MSVTNSLSAYQVGMLPVPRFEGLDNAKASRHSGHAADQSTALATIWSRVEGATEEAAGKPAWPRSVHDTIDELAARLLSACQHEVDLVAELKAVVAKAAEIADLDAMTGVTALDRADYLGWRGRYQVTANASVGDDDEDANRVAPHLDGEGPGGIPWNLIAAVYPSYPLPGISESSWASAAWEELCDILRKNKGMVGNTRIRADLTGTAGVRNPTGAIKKLQGLFADYHAKIRENRARAAELDFLIDRIVFRLFNLTLEEQKLILSRVGPGRPLPPKRRGKMVKVKSEGPGLFDAATS